MAWTRYSPKNPTRAWSCIRPDEWGYGGGFAVDTDAGVLTITDEKIGRALTLGVVGADLRPKGWRPEPKDRWSEGEDVGWCFDRRIVAMVADFLMKHGWDGGEGEPYPERGEEIHLPTAEEADAIYAKYGIPTPQTNEETDRLLVESVEVGDDGRPI